MNLSAEAERAAAAARGVKRASEGGAHCTCRGSCSTKMCGCVKAPRGCSPACRCQRALCRNRRASSDSDDKENHPSGAEYTTMDTTPPSSYFDKRDHLDATYVKKKKSYFFPQDAINRDTKKNILEEN